MTLSQTLTIACGAAGALTGSFLNACINDLPHRRPIRWTVGGRRSPIVELVTAALLLVPATAAIGGILAMGVMSGAIVSHVAVLGIAVRGDGGLLFALAVLVWLAAAGVVWIHRGLLPVVAPALEAHGGRP